MARPEISSGHREWRERQKGAKGMEEQTGRNTGVALLVAGREE